MTHDETTLQERIRELCTRVVKTEGKEFQFALAELADAIELWNGVKNDDGRGSS